MNTREIAEEYRLSHWAEIMKDRTASGLSIKNFCKAAGFHENVYYYWQRKLREAAYQEHLVEVSNTCNQAVIPSGWAICEEDTGSKTDESVLTVEIGKCRINAYADTSPELLRKVSSVLISLC